MPVFNTTQALSRSPSFQCNIKSWAIERGPSVIPRPSLDLPAFNVALKAGRSSEGLGTTLGNIKSWEIERGLGDDARRTGWCGSIHTYSHLNLCTHLAS